MVHLIFMMVHLSVITLAKQTPARSAFPLVYGDVRPEFPKGCYFIHGDRSECNGDIEHCELVCER